jgi:hypothetical protein
MSEDTKKFFNILLGNIDGHLSLVPIEKSSLKSQDSKEQKETEIPTVPEKSMIRIRSNGDYSELFSHEEWMSLFILLKQIPGFKLSAKSSSQDVFKVVYTVIGRVTIETWVSTEETKKMSFVVTSDTVYIDIYFPEDECIKRFVSCLLESELEMMPLFINDRDRLVKETVSWRLGNNV